MTTNQTRIRRERGDGGLRWVENRQRWEICLDHGFKTNGRRIRSVRYFKTKTEAKAALKAWVRQTEQGLSSPDRALTVRQAAEDWLKYSLTELDESTVKDHVSRLQNHVYPVIGKKKLTELTAKDVEKLLLKVAKTRGDSTLHQLHSALNRIVKRAMAQDLVHRNVVALVPIPKGTGGRPSRSMSLEQARSIIAANDDTMMYAYIVLSLLTGARTEEVRELRWEHVHLNSDEGKGTHPHLEVWRSVRKGGDTKTPKSRRTLALPDQCIVALTTLRDVQQREIEHLASQEAVRVAQGRAENRRGKGTTGRRRVWEDLGYVFPSSTGTPIDAHNMRRRFRKWLEKIDGITPEEWTPRELRHSFVSILSEAGVPLEEISRLVGHSTTATTERVYRHELRPVIQTGATAMNAVFRIDLEQNETEDSGSVEQS